MVKVSSQSQRHGSLWSRDELILAFDLYCRIPFRKTKANNPEVIELARLLSRTPASVARKLGNFGSFDPDLRKRHIVGLAHAGKLDNEIWDEFNNDWNRLVLEAARLRGALDASSEADSNTESELGIPTGNSEKFALKKNRVHQTFFRQAILSGYENKCCITGLKVEACLVASHIIPWSVSEQNRTNPRNGICLSATFDRLFDCGLITVTNDYTLIVSNRLLRSKDSQILNLIGRYHGADIIRPKRFLPLPAFLEWHRNNVFRN